MPWKVASAMSQREEFIALAQSEGVNMSELCLRSGISRKTGYKWLRRSSKAESRVCMISRSVPITPRTARVPNGAAPRRPS